LAGCDFCRLFTCWSFFVKMSKSVKIIDNVLAHVDEKKEYLAVDDNSKLRVFSNVEVKYTTKPLGLDVESGEDGMGLYVISSKHSEAPEVKPGMMLVQINEHVVRGLRADKIVEMIKGCGLPVNIHFSSASRGPALSPTRSRRVTLTRGLSLRIRRASTALPKEEIRVYLPNGTPVTVTTGKHDLNTVLTMVCAKHGLHPEKLVLIMQNREKENDVQHPSLNEPAVNWTRKFAKNYWLRLVSKKLAGIYAKGVPADGVSILTKNGFTDQDIQELRKFMNMLLHLSVDAAVSALSKTLETEYGELKLTKEEVMAIVEWHKSIVHNEDTILQAPDQHCFRVFFFEDDQLRHKTYNLKNPMTTAGKLCEIISKDLNINLPNNYAIHIKGLSDVRAFEQALNPEDIPNQIKLSIVKSGGYGRLQFVYKEINEQSDSEYNYESSQDIQYAPTARAFRVGSIDGWSDKDLEKLRKAMEEHMNEMKLQHAEFKTVEKDEEQLALEGHRLELLKECVLNQYQISEVIHNFEATSIGNFPAHKKLHDLRIGEVMIVTGTDVSGWSRGKNISGGDEAYFPASYVEVVAQPEMLVEVIHDFDPSTVSNLPKALVVIKLERGELILVTGTHISGWWRGCKVKGGPEGYFPGDYTNCITAPLMDVTFKKIYGDAVLEGHMKLRAGVFKRFQDRYVWLTNNELLYFNTEASDPQYPVGRIVLRHPNNKSSVVPKSKGKFIINVDRKSYECKVDEDVVSLWIETLTQICSGE